MTKKKKPQKGGKEVGGRQKTGRWDKKPVGNFNKGCQTNGKKKKKKPRGT